MKNFTISLEFWVCVLMIGPLTWVPASARGFCSEPLEPYCITATLSAGSGKSPGEVSDCRVHLERYLKNLIQYQKCLVELSAEAGAVVRDKRRLLDCEHNAGLCDGIPAP